MLSGDWRSWNAHDPLGVVGPDRPHRHGAAVGQHDVGLPALRVVRSVVGHGARLPTGPARGAGRTVRRGPPPTSRATVRCPTSTSRPSGPSSRCPGRSRPRCWPPPRPPPATSPAPEPRRHRPRAGDHRPARIDGPRPGGGHRGPTGGGWRVRYAIADVAAWVGRRRPDRRRGPAAHPDLLRCPTSGRRCTRRRSARRAASLLPDGPRPAVLWTIDVDADGTTGAVDVRRAAGPQPGPAHLRAGPGRPRRRPAPRRPSPAFPALGAGAPGRQPPARRHRAGAARAGGGARGPDGRWTVELRADLPVEALERPGRRSSPVGPPPRSCSAPGSASCGPSPRPIPRPVPPAAARAAREPRHRLARRHAPRHGPRLARHVSAPPRRLRRPGRRAAPRRRVHRVRRCRRPPTPATPASARPTPTSPRRCAAWSTGSPPRCAWPCRPATEVPAWVRDALPGLPEVMAGRRRPGPQARPGRRRRHRGVRAGATGSARCSPPRWWRRGDRLGTVALDEPAVRGRCDTRDLPLGRRDPRPLHRGRRGRAARCGSNGSPDRRTVAGVPSTREQRALPRVVRPPRSCRDHRRRPPDHRPRAPRGALEPPSPPA